MNFASHSSEFLLALAVGLAFSGLLAGLVGGLLGVGGGIVLVPVLFQVLTTLEVDESVRMQIAVGTSLATIIPTSLRSTRAHHAKGAVDWDLLKRWAPFVFVGAIGGGLLAQVLSGVELRLVFGGMAVLLALYMAFGRETWVIPGGMPTGLGARIVSFLIGAVSVLMGIGGGTFGVSAMTLFGTPIHRAVGTAAGLGLIIAIPGTIGFIIGGWGVTTTPPYSLGYVSLIGLALIIPATYFAAPWGADLAHRLSRRNLRLAFGIFLGASAARLLWGVF